MWRRLRQERRGRRESSSDVQSTIARVQELVRRAAAASGGVLLLAHRGGDVESVARELHERTVRLRRRVRAGGVRCRRCGSASTGCCSALPPSTTPADLEWASRRQPDRGSACGGALFLKDVTDMPASVQARIARVARDGEVRVDGEPAATDIRWMGAPERGARHRERSPAGRFRSDLLSPARRVPHRSAAAARSRRGREPAVLAVARRVVRRVWMRASHVHAVGAGVVVGARVARAIWPSFSWSSSAPRRKRRTTPSGSRTCSPALKLDSARDGSRAPAPFVPVGQSA